MAKYRALKQFDPTRPMLMTVAVAFAWSYVRYGALPAVEALLYGVKPAVLAVILAAVWRLGRPAPCVPRSAERDRDQRGGTRTPPAATERRT